MSQYEVAVRTDQGRQRSSNEDSYGLPPAGVGEEAIAKRGFLVAIADGVGGQAAGEIASQTAVAELQDAYYRRLYFSDVPDTLSRAIIEAHRVVRDRASAEEQAGMATTVVAAVLDGDKVTVAHVGDSRGYVVGATGSRQLTKDHTLVDELVASGALTEAEAAEHPYRHVLSRSLGGQSDVRPSAVQCALAADEALLLCTDGLWSQVSEETIAATVQSMPAAKAVGRLVELANAAGGVDNVTAVVVRQATAGRPAPVPNLRSARGRGFRVRVALLAGVVLGLLILLTASLLLRGGLNITGHTVPGVATPPTTPRAAPQALLPGIRTPQSTVAVDRGTSSAERQAVLKEPFPSDQQSSTYLFRDPNDQTGSVSLALDGSVRIGVYGTPVIGAATGYMASRSWYQARYQGQDGWVACPLVVFDDTGRAECQ